MSSDGLAEAAAGPTESPTGSAAGGWRGSVRWFALAGYGIVAGLVWTRNGLPMMRDALFLWLLGGLACLSLGNLRRFLRSALADWVPLGLALWAYDVVRGVGAGRVPIHLHEQPWLDRHLFGLGQVPSVWLQQRLLTAEFRWYDYVVWAVYVSFFVAPPVVLAALWLRGRERFRSYAGRLVVLTFCALGFFLVAPSVPPWLASEKGEIAELQRFVGDVNPAPSVFNWSTTFERGVELGNDIAAFPSLHQAMTVLLALFFWRTASPAMRMLLGLYCLAMAFSLVYTGEHYVVDLVAGAGLAAIVHRTAERRRRRAGRRDPAEPSRVPASP